MKKLPYVITEDIRTMSRFGEYSLSEQTARHVTESIRSHCETFVSKDLIMIPEKELTDWITKHAPSDGVIQTTAYSDFVSSPFSLQITRAIDENLNKIDSQVPRSGFPSLVSQLKQLKKFTPHHLVDDVIFSGEGAREVIMTARRMDLLFNRVSACVTIGEGKNILQSMGVDVTSLYHFESVIDEVCQRDFISGFPGSGRTLIDSLGRYYSVPYLLPWGNPEAWASVPSKSVSQFSINCITVAIDFWEEVSPKIKFFEVPAVVFDPMITNEDIYFIDYLYQCKMKLMK